MYRLGARDAPIADPLRTPLASSERTHLAPRCVKTRRPSARPRLLPGEPFQRGPIAHGPTMTKWIGKASLTMQPPRRIVLSYRFHIGRASLSIPFYEVIGRIDEDFDPGRRQAHVRRARLLHSYPAPLRGERMVRHRDQARQRRQDPTAGWRQTPSCTS